MICRLICLSVGLTWKKKDDFFGKLFFFILYFQWEYLFLFLKIIAWCKESLSLWNYRFQKSESIDNIQQLINQSINHFHCLFLYSSFNLSISSTIARKLNNYVRQLFNKYWMRLCIIWRIMEIEEDVSLINTSWTMLTSFAAKFILGRFPFVKTGWPDHCRTSHFVNEIGFF